jgi:hypothetical protein
MATAVEPRLVCEQRELQRYGTFQLPGFSARASGVKPSSFLASLPAPQPEPEPQPVWPAKLESRSGPSRRARARKLRLDRIGLGWILASEIRRGQQPERLSPDPRGERTLRQTGSGSGSGSGWGGAGLEDREESLRARVDLARMAAADPCGAAADLESQAVGEVVLAGPGYIIRPFL